MIIYLAAEDAKSVRSIASLLSRSNALLQPTFTDLALDLVYVWRIRELPSLLDIGVVCEHVYAPESEHSDLRIMSFDINRRGSGYDIAMVFSDSSIKVTIHVWSGLLHC